VDVEFTLNVNRVSRRHTGAGRPIKQALIAEDADWILEVQQRWTALGDAAKKLRPAD
jgi:hypothetical protein